MWTSSKRIFAILVVMLQMSSMGWSAELNCGVCNMTIPDHARHHIILSQDLGGKPPLHVCSSSCARKAKKHDSKYSKVEMADFNHPDQMLDGSKAFFLVKSEKIKSDLGPMAMPPFLAAFKTKKEADSAQKKYGDGVVVQGFEEALNTK